MSSFKRVSPKSEAEREANIARFVAARNEHIANPPSRVSYDASRPIAASIPEDRIIGGYQPTTVIIKHNHHSMSIAYNIIDTVKRIEDVTGIWDAYTWDAAKDSMGSVNGVHMTMAERIAHGGRKASRFDKASWTVHTAAVRKFDDFMARRVATSEFVRIENGTNGAPQRSVIVDRVRSGRQTGHFGSAFDSIPTGWGRVKHAAEIFGAEYNGAIISFVKPKAK